MIKEKSTVLVGFSGGGDSTALILSLWELRKLLDINIVAVHVNHCIRKEAADDADFVSKFCREKNIKCHIVERDIPLLTKKWNMTEEEAGRKARYKAFTEIAALEKAEYIAVAHHQNDVAETLLLNLLRGTGLHGAGAIRPVRGRVIRPLLCVSRKEIEEYLTDRNQDYCHDATNDENIHTRNVIRNLLIPTMEEKVNSSAIAHLCSAAEDFSEADLYIRKMAEGAFKEIAEVSEDKVSLELLKFRLQETIIQKEMILKVFEELTPHRKDISGTHVDLVMKLSSESEGSASVDLPYGLVAMRSYNTLEIKRKDTKISSNSLKEFEIPPFMKVGEKMEFFLPDLGMAHIEILQYNGGKLFPTSPYTKWFDYDRIQRAVFRTRKPYDFIMIEQDGGLCRKSVNKLFTDMKVPKSNRDGIFLLTDGSDVLWVPGYRMSGAYKVSGITKKILAINIDNGGYTNG